MTAQHFYLTIANPVPGDDVGEVAEGWYVVKGSRVLLTDSAGVPIGEEREIDRDALTTAKRLLRARLDSKHRAFNRRIEYPKARRPI